MAENYNEKAERLKEIVEKLKAVQKENITVSKTIRTTKKPYEYTQEELTTIPPEDLLKQILDENTRIFLASKAKKNVTWESNPNPVHQDPIEFKVPWKAEPKSGDSPGGYCITDRNHNILDIWDSTSEVEVCEKFNRLEKPKALKEKAIYLVPVSREGKGLGVIGSK